MSDTPSGDTPRTDAALSAKYGALSTIEVLEELASELERELTRAMRVVEAAKTYADYDDHDSAKRLKHAFWEWEAGR